MSLHVKIFARFLAHRDQLSYLTHYLRDLYERSVTDLSTKEAEQLLLEFLVYFPKTLMIWAGYETSNEH